MKRYLPRQYIAGTLFLLLLAGCAGASSGQKPERVLSVGYFPNITHAQALIAHERGDWKKGVRGWKVKEKLFSSGPSAIEAIFAEEIDIAYLGPFPAVNGYVKSKGEAVRIISGAAKGGALFIVHKKSGIKKPRDLNGKRIATPSIGNTQDISARDFILRNGMKPTQLGGRVEILPVKNAEILNLMKRGEVDGAWVPEPWAARILEETDAEIFMDEKELWPENFSTTVVVARKAFLESNPSVVDGFLDIHKKNTMWINKNPEKAKKSVNKQLKKITGKELTEPVIDRAFSNVEFTDDPIRYSVFEFARRAESLGFLRIPEGLKIEDVFNKKLTKRFD